MMSEHGTLLFSVTRTTVVGVPQRWKQVFSLHLALHMSSRGELGTRLDPRRVCVAATRTSPAGGSSVPRQGTRASTAVSATGPGKALVTTRSYSDCQCAFPSLPGTRVELLVAATRSAIAGSSGVLEYELG